MNKGWECPKCGKCHAPYVAHCDCYLNGRVYSGSTEGFVFSELVPYWNYIPRWYNSSDNPRFGTQTPYPIRNW